MLGGAISPWRFPLQSLALPLVQWLPWRALCCITKLFVVGYGECMLRDTTCGLRQRLYLPSPANGRTERERVRLHA